MAVYDRADGNEPDVLRFPQAAHAADELKQASELRGRIFNVHVRRATLGGLTPENTHPFAMGNYTFGHNGTVIAYPRLLEPGVPSPAGETDSEAIFNYLMHVLRPRRRAGLAAAGVSAVVARSAFSGLNFLFSDGERLYAYQLGIFSLHWLARPGQLLVASERVTEERWHTVRQDVLLTLDPHRLDEPHAERLLGDALVDRARDRPARGADAPPRRRAWRLRRRARGQGRRRRGRVSRRFLRARQPGGGRGAGPQAAARGTGGAGPPRREQRVVQTRDIDHAEAEARAAAEAGETVAAMGGDGLLRPVAGVLRGQDSARSRSSRAGGATTIARVLGIPTDPTEAARLAVEGDERLFDVAEVDGRPFLGIASFGFDSDANRIANEAKLRRGNLVYLYAALRALAAWKPARFTVTVDGERHELSGYSVAVANSRPTAAGCTWRHRP